jgi:DNA-binding MarR family transcriptional regulator
MRKAKTRPLTSDHQWAVTDRPPEDIARTLRLDRGLGFLVRLLDTRFKILYAKLTTQSEITPRQFGVLLTLYQCGTLTLTELAGHIRVDRSTLGEMIFRMEERFLITKRINENDRRSAEVSLAPFGKHALLELVSGVAQLQTVLLAQLAAEDRPHFMRCMKFIAEPGIERG